MSDYLHKLPGQHYFFQSYSASFSYYTGETATRLIPILPSEDVQIFAMPDGKKNMPCPPSQKKNSSN